MCSEEVRVIAPRLLLDNIPDLERAADDPRTEEIVRDADGRILIGVDRCIVPAVKALWGAGVVTLSSCCGHVAPEDDHPWGVITIQTKPGVGQRGAELLRRERYEQLLSAEAEWDRLRDLELERADDWLDPWVQTAIVATAELHKSHGSGPWRECPERWCRLVQQQGASGKLDGPPAVEAELSCTRGELLQAWEDLGTERARADAAEAAGIALLASADAAGAAVLAAADEMAAAIDACSLLVTDADLVRILRARDAYRSVRTAGGAEATDG